MALNYKEMTGEELGKLLRTSREELRELRFAFAETRSLQNPARPRHLRKTVARVLTELRARELQEQKAKAT